MGAARNKRRVTSEPPPKPSQRSPQKATPKVCFIPGHPEGSADIVKAAVERLKEKRPAFKYPIPAILEDLEEEEAQEDFSFFAPDQMEEFDDLSDSDLIETAPPTPAPPKGKIKAAPKAKSKAKAKQTGLHIYNVNKTTTNCF
jgi:hypothetical protein